MIKLISMLCLAASIGCSQREADEKTIKKNAYPMDCILSKGKSIDGSMIIKNMYSLADYDKRIKSLETENQKLKQDLESASKLNTKLYDKLSETIHLNSKVHDMCDALNGKAEDFAIEVCTKVELAFGTDAMLELFPKVCEL